MNQTGSAKMSGIYYKPLMTTSYAVLWSLSDGKPTLFHIFQVGLHCANAFLLFLFLSTFVAPLPAFILALVFLLHPINTENAVYIANLQDVLFTFFGLSALIILAKKRATWLNCAAFAVLLLCSLLSKESGILFIGASFLYLLFLPTQNRFRFAFSVAVSVLLYALLRFGLAGLYGVSHGVAPISRVPWIERFSTMPAALTHYFLEFIAPINLVTTQNWIVSDFNSAWFIFPLFFLLCFTAALVYSYKKSHSRSLAFFALSLGGGLLLHSHLLAPLDGTVADRWFYFPMLALLGCVAAIVKWDHFTTKQICIFAIPVLVTLTGRSLARSLDWENGYTLYKHDAEIAPDSYDIQNNYGVELFRHGEYQSAFEHFKRSTELAPHWTINWNNLGAIYEKANRPEDALAAYCKSVQNGIYYLAYENYASLLVAMKQPGEALGFLQEAGLVALPNNQKLLTLRDQLKAQNTVAKPAPCK